MTTFQYIENLPEPPAPRPVEAVAGVPAPTSSGMLPQTGFDLALLVLAAVLIFFGLLLTALRKTGK